MRIEFLWFQDCPNHEQARMLLRKVLNEKKVETPIEDIDATDPVAAEKLRFPGSPTIRINGHDVEPGYKDPGDYTPRCRLYLTNSGFTGIPERRWIEDALDRDAGRD